MEINNITDDIMCGKYLTEEFVIFLQETPIELILINQKTDEDEAKVIYNKLNGIDAENAELSTDHIIIDENKDEGEDENQNEVEAEAEVGVGDGDGDEVEDENEDENSEAYIDAMILNLIDADLINYIYTNIYA
jgi:hypothetical protein